jgi:hypothetical protein
MEPDQQVAIWIHDAAAKLFLGLNEKHPVSRWVVIGVGLHKNPSPIGPWLNVTYIEERRPMGGKKSDKIIRYGIKPGQAVIRWEYIITVQNIKDAQPPEDPRPMPGTYL